MIDAEHFENTEHWKDVPSPKRTVNQIVYFSVFFFAHFKIVRIVYNDTSCFLNLMLYQKDFHVTPLKNLLLKNLNPITEISSSMFIFMNSEIS